MTERGYMRQITGSVVGSVVGSVEGQLRVSRGSVAKHPTPARLPSTRSGRERFARKRAKHRAGTQQSPRDARAEHAATPQSHSCRVNTSGSSGVLCTWPSSTRAGLDLATRTFHGTAPTQLVGHPRSKPDAKLQTSSSSYTTTMRGQRRLTA